MNNYKYIQLDTKLFIFNFAFFILVKIDFELFSFFLNPFQSFRKIH